MIQNRLEDGNVNTESNEKKYKWSIDFQRNGKANYEPCYKCEKQSLTYRIEDSTLYLNDNQIKISAMSADSLVLTIDKSKHILVPMKK